MTMPNRAGKFRAEVIDGGVAESGQQKLATVVLKLRLLDELIGGEWRGISTEGLEITSYNYLEKKDGTVNTKTVESLRKAFTDWDGADLAYWDGSAGSRVQATLEFERYNGEDRLKVRWINPYDDAPGGAEIKKATPEERRAILNRLGAKLRATSGGTPVPPKSAAPKAAPSKPPVNTSIKATMDEAWAEFEQRNNEMGEQDRVNAWFAYIKTHTGKDDPAAVTPEEWGKIKSMLDEIPF